MSRRAFTLLELVLALAIAAVLAMSLYASLRTGFKTRQSAQTAIEPPRTAALAMELLAADFENALPPTGLLAGPFVGTDAQDDRGHDADDIILYTTADAPDGPDANGDITQVELTVIVPDGSTDHVLVRRVTRNLLAQIVPEPVDEVICRGVDRFNVRYFDGTEWVDDWDSTQQGDTLPLAVEVTLALARPAGSANQPPQTFQYVRVFPLPCSDPAAQQGGTAP